MHDLSQFFGYFYLIAQIGFAVKYGSTPKHTAQSNFTTGQI